MTFREEKPSKGKHEEERESTPCVCNDHGTTKTSYCPEQTTCHLLYQEHQQQLLEEPSSMYKTKYYYDAIFLAPHNIVLFNPLFIHSIDDNILPLIITHELALFVSFLVVTFWGII
jgi:hypothetical protein